MKHEAQNIIKLPVRDLAKKIICDGHLFLLAGDRKFYLMKPGVFVDPAFLKKHTPKDSTFDFEVIVNNQTKDTFVKLFRELRYLQFENDLRQKCFEILQHFCRCYSNKEHFLSFALACHEEFCQISIEDQTRMHETDLHLYRKALYSSAFAVLSAIANEYYHFLMIRDFYNITFALDIGLCEVDYSYFVAEACNAENRQPGSGKQYLEKEKATESEKEVFFKHPERSHAFFKKAAFLAYPELAEITLYQHELADGTGFPRAIKKGQVSNWEAIVIFSDSLVEICSEYSFENDVISYLLSFENQKLKELPIGKVYRKILRVFELVHSHKETGS
jgi:hypothetical protein